MTFQEIRREIEAYPTRFVEFTGGEPLEQPYVHSLMEQLADDGWTVAVETGGHIDISPCDPRVIRIVDFKPPGSGMMKKNMMENISFLRRQDEVKFVCASAEDYEWARDIVRTYGVDARVAAVFISPVHGAMEPLDLVQRILGDGLNARFQVQLHKIIWNPETRGV